MGFATLTATLQGPPAGCRVAARKRRKVSAANPTDALSYRFSMSMHTTAGWWFHRSVIT